MNVDPINISIVGPGRVAKRLANAIHLMDEIKLWSICSRQLDNAKSFADQYNATAAVSAYDNFNNMLKDPNLHAVIIATPDNFHFQYASEALKHGKHIFIEKPLCTNIEEGKRLIELANEKKCIAAIGYHLRWHPGLRLLAQEINADDFGKVNHINISWAHTFIEEANWRNNRDQSRWWSLTTLGTHCLDIVRWLMLSKCGEVKNIKCMTTNSRFGLNDENAMIALEFESGATANIFTSILFDSLFQIEIHGEKNCAKGINLVSQTNKGELFINNSPMEYSEPNNLYACELKNFANAINGKEIVEVSLSEGLRNIELLIKCE